MSVGTAPLFDHDDLMSGLEAGAVYLKPRLFAMYGIHHAFRELVPERPFLGWGMHFDAAERAIYWEPEGGSTHCSSGAEQLLATHQRIATAKLRWLT